MSPCISPETGDNGRRTRQTCSERKNMLTCIYNDLPKSLFVIQTFSTLENEQNKKKATAFRMNSIYRLLIISAISCLLERKGLISMLRGGGLMFTRWKRQYEFPRYPSKYCFSKVAFSGKGTQINVTHPMSVNLRLQKKITYEWIAQPLSACPADHLAFFKSASMANCHINKYCFDSKAHFQIAKIVT